MNAPQITLLNDYFLVTVPPDFTAATNRVVSATVVAVDGAPAATPAPPTATPAAPAPVPATPTTPAKTGGIAVGDTVLFHSAQASHVAIGDDVFLAVEQSAFIGVLPK